MSLLKRKRPEQVGEGEYVFALDLLAQGIVHVVLSERVVWKGKLRKITRRIYSMIKLLCLFAGDSEARL